MDDYVPWQAGWLLGKYQQYTRWPTPTEFDEWLEGFQVGTTEVCEYHIWPQRLREYTSCKVVPNYLLMQLDNFDKIELPPDPSDIESQY